MMSETVKSFKVTVHMVTSLDGYIAKKDNSVSWFETADNYENGTTVTPEQVADFLTKIDCYVMGAHTYLHAVELSKTYGWPYGDIPTIVVSHRNLPIERKNVELYSGDLDGLVNQRLKPNYNNIWVAGGAILIRDLLRLNLADEIRQSILPVILGDGVPLFDDAGKEQPLHLKNVTPYKSGMVELVYEVKK